MNYCEKCSYILDINKIGSLSQTVFKNITKINDVFKIIESDNDLTSYKIQFPVDELLSSKKYKALDDTKKNRVDIILNNTNSILSSAEFKCNNCNYATPITNTVLLYELNFNDTIEKINTISENKLIINDPLLPHTRDYICKNVNCITNVKNSTVQRDAVFYKNF